MRHSDQPDSTTHDVEVHTNALDVRARRLGDATRQIAALANRTPDDVAMRPEAVVTELSDLAREVTNAHEQLRRKTIELAHARELLDAERERFRDLFEVAPEGLIITDPFGTIREANRGAAALLNIPMGFLVGKPLAVFVDTAERRAFRVRVYRARVDSAEEGWTATLQPRNGESTRVFVAVSPLLDARGGVTGLRWLVRDVSNRRAPTVRDRTPVAILRAAIDALSAHVAVLDTDGTILTVNRAWREATRPAGMFDRSAAGANYLDLCEAARSSGHVEAAAVQSAVTRVLDGHLPHAELLYRDRSPASSDTVANDQVLWFALRARRCDGPDPATIVVTHEDVTAERRASARETALITERSARAAAESANRAKSEFLATLSHELRTPLNAIAGYAQLLEMGVRGPVTREQSEDLRRILRSEQHLVGLINELLNFARIERGEVAIEVGPIAISSTIREVMELVEPQATAKHLALSVDEVDPDLVAAADADRLRQVLLNLLTNAVKFTPDGGAIRVGCAADDSRVVISVQDTGVGIPRTKQEQVFDPFVQIDRGPGSPSEGIGLGLAISRTLARAMGGDITVRSEPGKGSRFDLSLSRATADATLS